MLALIVLVAAALAPAAVHAKVFERCELARELARRGVPADELPVWVCIARHESEFNTTAVGHVGEGGDHGIFQVSDIYWCSHRGPGKACGMACAQLLDDDIGDDLACVRRIHREHQGLSGNGFNAWAVYPTHCKRNPGKYVEGCFRGTTGNELQPQPVYGLPPGVGGVPAGVPPVPAITAPPPPARPHRPRLPWQQPSSPVPVFGLPAVTAPAALSRRLGGAPPARPQRPAADPRHFWNWQFLPRRRWF